LADRAEKERAVDLENLNARRNFQIGNITRLNFLVFLEIFGNQLDVRFVDTGGASRYLAVGGLEIAPDFAAPKIGLAYLEVVRNGNPAAGSKILQTIPAGICREARWDLAMLERDYAAAEKILTDSPWEDFSWEDAPKTYYQGRTALARGDNELAQRYAIYSDLWRKKSRIREEGYRRPQDAILSVSGEALARLAGRAWDDADRAGLDEMKKIGVRIDEASPELVKGVQERTKAIVDKWVAGAKAKGIDGAKVLAAFREEVKRVAAGQ